MRFVQSAPMLPNLIVIGGAKCGPTSLHYYLRLHPEIFMSCPAPPRLNLQVYPYLPQATVATTLAKSYLSLMAGAAS